jgi:exopolyphosphatase/guanosine-5'-triphosphate,3'-diphosphate pyrophosphatase
VDRNPRYAALDVGSHTIRLLIARLDENRHLVPLCNERRVTRLAHQLQVDQRLKPSSIRGSLEALEEYAGILASHRVTSVTCGATGAVRRAHNGQAFLDQVREATGIDGSILSETSEAFLSAKGVVSVLPDDGRDILTFDLGGSTTEFLHLKGRTEETVWSSSVFVGAATITERFLSADLPGDAGQTMARLAVRRSLREVMDRFARDSASEGNGHDAWKLVGTAGTVTTLAALKLRMLHYSPYRVNGEILTEPWLSEVIGRLSNMSLSERRRLPGIEEGREDIILGGALIVHEILAGLGRSSFVVTDAGLLEGQLLDLIEKDRFQTSGLRTSLVWRLPKDH